MLDKLTGIYSFEYSLNSGREEGISDPAFMEAVERFSQWWKQFPEVLHVNTYTDVMKKLNKTMHGDDESWYRLPDNEELAAQYLLLYEMSLPFGLDLNNQINISKSSVKFTVTLENIDTKTARRLATLGDKWLLENAPESAHAHATGPTVMFSHISQRNIQSMIRGTLIALILITLLMTVALKSVKYGLISLLINSTPAIMAFGLWSLIFGQAGMAISIVASATLGIIVDDSVHFLTKYARARRENNLNVFDAIQYTFSTVGLAIIITSVILFIGFLVMAYSPFLLNMSLGALSAITIAFALIMDLVFLPTLLVAIDGKGGQTSKT